MTNKIPDMLVLLVVSCVSVEHVTSTTCSWATTAYVAQFKLTSDHYLKLPFHETWRKSEPVSSRIEPQATDTVKIQHRNHGFKLGAISFFSGAISRNQPVIN